MSKQILIPITLIIVAALILSGCGGTPEPTTTQVNQETPTPTSTSAPTPTIKSTPADIKVIYLSVTPIVAEPGKPITVEVKVTNAGGTEGSHKLALNINGTEKEAKEVTLAPSTNNTLTFTVTENIPGLYEIEVAGLTETLRVKQSGAYPRLCNYYLAWLPKSPYLSFLWDPPEEPTEYLKTLARWDIIAIPYPLYIYAPKAIQQIKRLNPRIKILAFIWVGESDATEMRPAQSSNESWYLHFGNVPGSYQTPEQRRIGFMTETMPGCWYMNPASGWATYLPNYVYTNIMSSRLFDGVFYDNIFENVGSWFNNVDIDNDGVIDSNDIVNREYNNGMTIILKLTRELLGPEAIIMGNPGAEWSANSPYFMYANGQLQENALGTSDWSTHEFLKIWDIYQRNMQNTEPPFRMHWIVPDTNGQLFDNINPNLPSIELQKMRYGLALTLLDYAYFGFDSGVPWHCQLWWFPEYDANLGMAKGDAQQRNDGTWTREFENGVVLVNPTNDESSIEFVSIYQDVTTSEKGTHFVVKPNDGRIFIKSA
jgi:hypothetical protein